MTSDTKLTKTTVIEDRFGPFRRLTLDNQIIRAIVLPELGGKMISLARCASGYEHLLQASALPRNYVRPGYGARFEDYDRSGFDECIPTIAACQYRDGEFRGVFLPDHGEVWSVAWRYETDDEGIALLTEGRRLPFALGKRLQLREQTLLIDYELRNCSGSDIKYLWSAHALLAVRPGGRVILPHDVHKLLIEWSRDDRLGHRGESCLWPVAVDHNGKEHDLSIVPPPSGHAEKLFTNRLAAGYCGYYCSEANESLLFRFDAQAIPYVGLWLCFGGWPESLSAKDYTVGLEPCTGRPDSLVEACARGENDLLPARGCKVWTLRLELRAGPPDIGTDYKR